MKTIVHGKALLIGLLTSTVVFTALLILTALALFFLSGPVYYLSFWTPVVIAVTAFVGAYKAAQKAQFLGWLHGLLVALMLLGTAYLFLFSAETSFLSLSSLLVELVLLFIASILGGMAGVFDESEGMKKRSSVA
ncbi:TIGR04086 family membrane protein [Heliorestis acidaminivorans]|nr:TIGR04086 family membrane protein [Heliorestis acidaminivorans]